jgi:hypothetical protein
MTPRQAMDAVLELYGLRYPDASAVIRDLAQRGFAIVPLEPSEKMMEAIECGGEKRQWPSGRSWLSGWRKMIKASQ